MMFGWMMAVASAASVGVDDGQVWMMPGGVDCDAREVLMEAVEDELLDFDEARRVAACDRTTAMHLGVMKVFQATRDGVEAHEEDPAALAVYARAAGTIRNGLVGDGVRLALQLQIAEALEGAEPGPWQDVIGEVAAWEPGPMPIEDPPVLAETVRRGVLAGPDRDVWQWGRRSLHSAYILATLPWMEERVAQAQVALESEHPRRALESLQKDWVDDWVPTDGYVNVTLDLMRHEALLRERWEALLSDM